MIEELKRFVGEARGHGYAVVRDVPVRREPDGSSSLVFARGDWQYHDNFFGGDPFAGREVVHRAARPVWCMVYYGATSTAHDPNQVFRWVRAALRAAEPGARRGPAGYQDADWSYSCAAAGDIERFSGSEQIELSGAVVYRADFAGGWVDRVDAL